MRLLIQTFIMFTKYSETDISKALFCFWSATYCTHRSRWLRRWVGTATVKPIRCADLNALPKCSPQNLNHSYRTSATAWIEWILGATDFLDLARNEILKSIKKHRLVSAPSPKRQLFTDVSLKNKMTVSENTVTQNFYIKEKLKSSRPL